MRSAGTWPATDGGSLQRTPARMGRIAAAALVSVAGCAMASVVPDGGSATVVATGADGRVTVGIAGTVGGVSVNTYRQFHVLRAGVDLDNRGVGARTILNQVTGTDRSLLAGPLGVLGPRANVVIANPNGISVNGMVLRNAGNLALTTGQVTFRDFATGNGGVQRNLVLDTSDGAIEIGAEGLAGSLLNLELAARWIRVDGHVENRYSDPNARIRAVVGNSRAQIDTSISPTDNLSPWIRYVAPSVAAGKPVALDITAAGGLTAGRIELLITDRGAGVRHAGNALATAGDFVLSTTGDVHLGAGTVRANGAVHVRGASATLDATAIDGVAGTALTANRIAMQRATVRSSGGAVTLTAADDYVQRDSDVLAAAGIALRAGTVTLESVQRQATMIADGAGVLVQSRDALMNHGALVQGRSRIAGEAASRGAVTLQAGGTVVNESTPRHLGIVFGLADDIVVEAGGDVVNRHARMLSNGFLNVMAAGDVRNEVTAAPAPHGGQPVSFRDAGRRWLWLSKRTAGFDVDYGALERPGQTAYLLSGKGTTLRGRDVVNRGGEIYANGGDITVRAERSFRTEGIAVGSAHYARRCMIVCRMSASSTTAVAGGLLSAGGNIDIRAGDSAANVGGRVLALGNLLVVAPLTYAVGLANYTPLARDRGFKAFFGDTWARLYAADVGGNWIAVGRGRIDGDAVIEGGSVDGDVEIAGDTAVVRPRLRTPVAVENHLGMTSWLWR